MGSSGSWMHIWVSACVRVGTTVFSRYLSASPCHMNERKATRPRDAATRRSNAAGCHTRYSLLDLLALGARRDGRPERLGHPARARGGTPGRSFPGGRASHAHNAGGASLPGRRPIGAPERPISADLHARAARAAPRRGAVCAGQGQRALGSQAARIEAGAAATVATAAAATAAAAAAARHLWKRLTLHARSLHSPGLPHQRLTLRSGQTAAQVQW